MNKPDRFKVKQTVTIAGAEAETKEESDPFGLSCGASGCAAVCCAKSPPIVLNPYEISRICRESGMSYEDLLDVVETERAAGFPLVLLPREPVCHFYTESGCGIYRARPLACRLFPLGRVYAGGRSHLVLPAPNVCSGMTSSPSGTVRDYLLAQDTAVHIQMADHWIAFVNAMEQLPLPDRPVTSVAFHMLVYSPDTPPTTSTGDAAAAAAPEESFLLRLETAKERLPRFLCKA